MFHWFTDYLTDILGSNRKSYIIQTELNYNSTMVSFCCIFQPMSLFQDYVLIMPCSCRSSYFSSYWPLFSPTSLLPEQVTNVSFISEFFKISPSGNTQHRIFSFSTTHNISILFHFCRIATILKSWTYYRDHPWCDQSSLRLKLCYFSYICIQYSSYRQCWIWSYLQYNGNKVL